MVKRFINEFDKNRSRICDLDNGDFFELEGKIYQYLLFDEWKGFKCAILPTMKIYYFFGSDIVRPVDAKITVLRRSEDN